MKRNPREVYLTKNWNFRIQLEKEKYKLSDNDKKQIVEMELKWRKNKEKFWDNEKSTV